MPKLRLALVGYGNAANLHLPGYRQLGPERCEVVAVCGHSLERAQAYADKHAIPHAFGSLTELLASVDVDAVDLVVPNHVHRQYAIEAAQAGKHVIVEKPLTGYFGDPNTAEDEMVGKTVSKRHMLERVIADCDAILDAVKAAGVKLCYAENWCYAPAFTKLRRLVNVAGGTILRLEAEESHSGSPSIYAADTTLGGVHNYLEAYLSNARVRANINPNDACVAYAPADHIFGDEYLTEKIETKGGWSCASPDDAWMQGYAHEIADFVGAIAEDREPLSGAILARDVSIVLYAAYVSAEEGRRVEVKL